MTVINTNYENLGPVVKEVGELLIDNFFRTPDDSTVYRAVYRQAGILLALSLDDLTIRSFNASTVVEPLEVNKIDITVDIL